MAMTMYPLPALTHHAIYACAAVTVHSTAHDIASNANTFAFADDPNTIASGRTKHKKEVMLQM
jgi:hypothetical protein